MPELIGLEHEYRLSKDGPVDFQRLIHRLGLSRPSLDPADLNAYRLASGAALTADGSEAEIALPPTSVEAGFTQEVASNARRAHDDLRQLLPDGLQTQGYSTHISVSIHPRQAERVALLCAQSFAPALMLLMDTSHSLGLLVRPRRNRIEFGGEYAAGLRLRAVLALAAGCVRACSSGNHPPKLALRLALDDQRYGWYVDRRAFGPDLYREGRKARLRLAEGGTITAQEQLQAAWSSARDALAGIASDDDLRPADQMVSGDIPLSIEDPDYPVIEEPIEAPRRQSIYGKVLVPRHTATFEMAPVMVTWDICVFVIVNLQRTRQAFACVPRADLESFIEQLDSGALDDRMANYLSRPVAPRTLDRYDQTHQLGLYDLLGPRWQLLAPELHPRARRWQRLLIARQASAPLGRTPHDHARRLAAPVIERILGYG